MSKNSKGVYQLENGYWGFRYTYTINEKKKDVKKQKTSLEIVSKLKSKQ